MFFTRPSLTPGSRPELLPDEDLLIVQDSVGLYENKLKILSCQKGHAYLTSHRACYIDDIDPRNNSLAIDLKDIDRYEFQAAFLRSSAKVTLFPKPVKGGFGSLRQCDGSISSHADRAYSASSPVSRVHSPYRDAPARAASPLLDRGMWICSICSFSNPVPSNFDPTIANESFTLPPCLTCGIRPDFAHVLKAAIAANPKRPQARHASASMAATAIHNSAGVGTTDSVNGPVTCHRCTFSNHPSMRNCEVCGVPLLLKNGTQVRSNLPQRASSPGPEIASLDLDDDLEDASIKFSFRAGGDKAFYEKLKNAMIQRKWLLQHAPPIPKPDLLRGATSDGVESMPPSRPQSTSVGIAGLEQRGHQSRRDNETVLGSAFEDLEALMSSAKDIVALAEKFASESGTASSNALLSDSANALGMVATKDMVADNSNTLYISELSRNLAEYVTDERRGILRLNGGIVGLVDLWAMINRARNGVELISPTDFHNAAEAWDRLHLPLRLRQFKSGVLVVQPRDWTDDKTISQLINWLRSLQASRTEEGTKWDWATFGFGVTAQEAASRFGWSLGVANEELEMAEEKGALCREEGIEGLKFWLNNFVDIEEEE